MSRQGRRWLDTGISLKTSKAQRCVRVLCGMSPTPRKVKPEEEYD